MPWIIWAIAVSYVFFDSLQQMVPGVIGTALLGPLQIDAAALGTFGAFYFYSYAAMQIPVGLITDRFGPHRPLVIAVLVAAGGSALFAISGGLASAQMSRMLIGMGTAFAYVSCLKLVSHWFPHSRFATLACLTGMVGMLGSITGDAPLADAVEHLGWRETSGVLVAIAVVLAILVWRVVRDHPPGARRWEDHPEHKRGASKTLADLKHTISKWQSWGTALYITTMNATFPVFGEVWGIVFIERVYDIGEVEAAVVVSTLFAGGLFGSISWGLISDRIRRRRLPMILAASGALVIMLVILHVPGVQHLPLRVACILIGLQGFCCSGAFLGFAVGNDIRPPGSAGAPLGFLNTCAAAGTALFLPITGWLLDVRSPERAAQGISALSAGDLCFAMTFIIVCLSVALLAAVFSRETHCQLLYDEG